MLLLQTDLATAAVLVQLVVGILAALGVFISTWRKGGFLRSIHDELMELGELKNEVGTLAKTLGVIEERVAVLSRLIVHYSEKDDDINVDRVRAAVGLQRDAEMLFNDDDERPHRVTKVMDAEDLEDLPDGEYFIVGRAARDDDNGGAETDGGEDGD